MISLHLGDRAMDVADVMLTHHKLFMHVDVSTIMLCALDW